MEDTIRVTGCLKVYVNIFIDFNEYELYMYMQMMSVVVGFPVLCLILKAASAGTLSFVNRWS